MNETEQKTKQEPYQDLEQGLGLLCCFPFFSGLGTKIKESFITEKIKKDVIHSEYGTITMCDKDIQTEERREDIVLYSHIKVCYHF